MTYSLPVRTYFWQDREIRFDVPLCQLKLHRGEIEIDAINSIEDTKGNNGEKGALMITNLRLVWCSHSNPKTNLSIGYNCIVHTNIRLAASKLRGNTEGLYVMTKMGNTRYEFIFTSLVKKSPRLFTTVQSVIRAYETSRLYRELKLRGAIMENKNLILLPDEEMMNKIDGVWNLSSEQGNLGSFFVTNVRLVWYASLAENFNVSIPYLKMKTIRVRKSKFGMALVIETLSKTGGYVLGFRIDPESKLEAVMKEVSALFEVYSANPIFGLNFSLNEKSKTVENVHIPEELVEDTVEVIDTDRIDNFGSYYADAGKTDDRKIVFDRHLGLAIEELRPDQTTKTLWNFMSTD